MATDSSWFGRAALELKLAEAHHVERAERASQQTGRDMRSVLIDIAGLMPHEIRRIDDHLSQANDQATELASPRTKPALTLPRGVVSAPRLRYEQLRELGRGGLGVVFLSHDKNCKRDIAFKTLRRPEGSETDSELFAIEAEDIERFVEEAQVCAQLEHPNIIPIYEIGSDEDDMPYYTMRAIHGTTLTRMLRAYHTERERLLAEGQLHLESEATRQLTLKRSRLYQAFADICKAIAYAHSKGVIHRDLKSDNIMLGEFGETIVLDWGIAKVKASASQPERDLANRRRSTPVESIRDSSAFMTLDGAIMGTPSYMPPEQAKGETENIDESSDVYSLGAILYEILCGAPPFKSETVFKTLDKVIFEEVRKPSFRLQEFDWFALNPVITEEGTTGREPVDRLAVPEVLEAICLRCLEKQKFLRYKHAGELLDEILNFLEGSKFKTHQRSLALAKVDQARRLFQTSDSAQEEVQTLTSQLEQRRRQIKSWEPLSAKQEIWELENRIERARRKILDARNDAVNALVEANGFDNTMPEVREAFADYYWSDLVEADFSGNSDDVRRLEVKVRQFDDGKYAESLVGDGGVTLEPDREGVEFWVYRYFDNGRESVPIPLELWDYREAYVAPRSPEGELLVGTPEQRDSALVATGKLHDFAFPKASYLFLLKADGCPDVRYPLILRRSEHYQARVQMRAANEIPPGFVYLPASRFVFGGDRLTNNVEIERLRVADFMMSRFPVTVAEYLAFLNSIADRAKRRARCPRESFTEKLLWWIDADDRVWLPDARWHSGATDAQRSQLARLPGAKQVWSGDWPVVGISWEDATAYCAWKSSLGDGLVYSLPTEQEWEKAARGADARYFPWGSGFDDTFLNCAGARESGPCLQPINSYAIDASPYGVRGMGGNVRDWCENTPSSRASEVRMIRGGSWMQSAAYARSASRPGIHMKEVNGGLGFRTVIRLGK